MENMEEKKLKINKERKLCVTKPEEYLQKHLIYIPKELHNSQLVSKLFTLSFTERY